MLKFSREGETSKKGFEDTFLKKIHDMTSEALDEWACNDPVTKLIF